jgi:hypothetical protein
MRGVATGDCKTWTMFVLVNNDTGQKVALHVSVEACRPSG